MDSKGPELLRQCTLPDKTELQEHLLITPQSIMVGERSEIDFGLEGDEIVVCELSSVKGDIHAAGDLRLDNWCTVTGDVICGGDAYLGEGVKIDGRLTVQGDLDLGDNVQIGKGFETKGWISIRNPMPVVAYIILYLITLLGLEREEDISEMLAKLFGTEEEDESLVTPLILPANTILSMDIFEVPVPMTIGSDCRLHGNIRAQSVVIGNRNTIFGSLRAEKSVRIGHANVVHGKVSAGTEAEIFRKTHVLGAIRCRELTLDDDVCIDGMIQARDGVQFRKLS